MNFAFQPQVRSRSTSGAPIRALRTLSLALGSSLVLSGCVTDLTGIGAESDFACPSDDGTLCASMADISRMSRRGELPWEKRRAEARARAEAEEPEAANAPGGSAAANDSDDSTDASSANASSDVQPKRVEGIANVVSSPETSERTEKTSAEGPSKGSSKSAAEAREADKANELHPESEPRSGFRANRPLGARLTESWGRSPLTAWATPERTPERLVRIFVAPWTDRDGDLHDAHYVYAAVTPPEWNTARRRRPDGRAVVKLPFELNRPARADGTREVGNLDAAYGSFGTLGSFDTVGVDDVKDPFGHPSESDSDPGTNADRSGAERLRADRARRLSAARRLAEPAAAFGGVETTETPEATGETATSGTSEAPETPEKSDAS